jgi:hypothetical protein
MSRLAMEQISMHFCPRSPSMQRFYEPNRSKRRPLWYFGKTDASLRRPRIPAL